jgi:peptide/nickel transport system permease protein
MTVVVGIAASVVSMGLGTFVGMISGYLGGWVDEILMRITDFFLVLPTLVLALILAGILSASGGGNVFTIVLIIGISLWSSTARLVRSQVLSLKQRQFIERAKAIGASNTRIVWFHIFPNAFSLVFAEAILTVAVAILTESFLSYLHLGPSGVVTWGKIIDDALSHDVIIRQNYMWLIAPGFAIVLVVLGFTLLGYALDEIFNPRLRKR